MNVATASPDTEAARDALRTLEALGIVEIKMGKGGGARIARGNPRLFAEALAVQLDLTGVTPGEVMDAQRAIECLSAELAAENATEADIARLRQLIEWMGEDFSGVIVFDEAHEMAGVAGGEGRDVVNVRGGWNDHLSLTGVEQVNAGDTWTGITITADAALSSATLGEGSDTLTVSTVVGRKAAPSSVQLLLWRIPRKRAGAAARWARSTSSTARSSTTCTRRS